MPYKDPEKARESARLRQITYRKKHPSRSKESQKIYRQNHPERAKEQSSRWRLAHPEEFKVLQRKWWERNHDKALQYWKIHYARRRGLRYSVKIFLNSWFVGSVLHHVSEGVGAYIPRKMHESVKHNLRTGLGMEEINQLTTEWLKK